MIPFWLRILKQKVWYDMFKDDSWLAAIEHDDQIKYSRFLATLLELFHE